MEIKFVMFLFSAVLPVPFVYGTTSIPDVCAVPPSSGFQGKNGVSTPIWEE